jgi:hypothetical protein
MPKPPPLTDDDRQAALAKAAEARRQRAALKEELKEGKLSLADVFDQAESDPVVAGTKILVILESLPGNGKVKSRRDLESCGIAESRRVRGVGHSQRERLLALHS